MLSQWLAAVNIVEGTAGTNERQRLAAVVVVIAIIMVGPLVATFPFVTALGFTACLFPAPLRPAPFFAAAVFAVVVPAAVAPVAVIMGQQWPWLAVGDAGQVWPGVWAGLAGA